MRFLLGVRGSSALCFFLLACGSSKPSEPNDARPDAGSDSDPNVVTLDSGPVRGTREDGVLALRGIPYAAPPVDEGRWRAPQPVASWTEIRDASKFGAKCVQTTPDSSEAAGGSEDCLTLNPVPLILFDKVTGGRLGLKQTDTAGLSSIAATVANLLGLEKHAKWDEGVLEVI